MSNLQKSMSKLGFKTPNSRSSFVPNEDATPLETAIWLKKEGLAETYPEIQKIRKRNVGQHPGYEDIEKAQIEFGTQVLEALRGL